MVVFNGCAQNRMGKIDALEGIFMSGVGQLVWLGNGYLNGKIYSAENEKREKGNKIIFGGNAIARKQWQQYTIE